MDMDWFDDVLVLLEERNMTRAAARRNVTQPAFSRRIRSFETWLGVEILERKTNRIEISDALAVNEAEIRAMMARLKELRVKIAHYSPERSTVAIAAQHATVASSFSDMALRAQAALPELRYRLRAGNMRDCLSLFLRGDVDMLLCYEGSSTAPLRFGSNVQRGRWGRDYLVPVVGGALRYSVRGDQSLPADTPGVVYPLDSYFGEILNTSQRPFGTRNFTEHFLCETAFTSGMYEMVRKGLGVGWLPISMVFREIESGDMISLAQSLGQEPMEVVLYANVEVDIAQRLFAFWAK